MDTDTMANKRLRNMMHITMSTIADMAMGTKRHIATDTMVLIVHSG
jgi:DNA-binding Xre family transcriptional regulator